MAKKLDAIKIDFNSQILQAINTAIAGKVFPQLQNSIDVIKSRLGAQFALQSVEFHNNPRVNTSQKGTPNSPKMN